MTRHSSTAPANAGINGERHLHYILRLFENDVEVSTTSVAITPNGQDYPAAGQTINDRWLVTEMISSDNKEKCFRVKRLDSRNDLNH